MSLVWVGKTLILGLGTLFKHLILISRVSFAASIVQRRNPSHPTSFLSLCEKIKALGVHLEDCGRKGARKGV